MKIRIWQTVRKIMVTSGLDKMVTVNDDGSLDAHGHIINYATGFNDKNSLSIYQDDILTDERHPQWSSRVIFENGCFGLQKSHPSGAKLRVVCTRLSIKGNIHQSPII